MEECGSDGVDRLATPFSTSKRRRASLVSSVLETLAAALMPGTGSVTFEASPKWRMVDAGSPPGGLRFRKGVLFPFKDEEEDEVEEAEEEAEETCSIISATLGADTGSFVTLRKPHATTAVPGVAPID